MLQKEQQFKQILVESRNSIYRICLGYIYDKSFANDLYQEIMLQIWKSLENYRGEAMMSTWVYRIAINTAITWNLQNKKNQHHLLPELPDVADTSLQATELNLQTQLSSLHHCISQLEEQDRIIISLVLEEMSYKDIADIIGTNTNHVGVRITRIKARLAKLMEQEMKQND